MSTERKGTTIDIGERTVLAIKAGVRADLADRMGTTQPTVARLEAGGVTPRLDTLQRAAEALGLELVVDFR